jgi:hypothetical protein
VASTRGIAGKFPQPFEPDQLAREARVAGIQAARVGEDEDASSSNALGLLARPGRASLREDLPVERDPQERHDVGAKPGELALQGSASPSELLGTKLVGGSRHAVTEVGQGEPVIEQAALGLVADRFIHQARSRQEPPEGVALTGEVVTQLAGAKPGVDPHEKDSRAGAPSFNDVAQSLHVGVLPHTKRVGSESHLV